jgi:uncharacterized protein
MTGSSTTVGPSIRIDLSEIECMSKTLIIPGFRGSGEGHWQRHWLASDINAVLVEQDSWDQPDLESWMQRLAEYVARHPGSTLVAHSLGVPLVAHFAHRYPWADVDRALLVAPADVEVRVATHACFGSFVRVPRSRLPFPSTVVASRNDPFIGFDRAAHFAAAWGSRLVDMGYAGHINIDSGYGPWAEAIDLLPNRAAPPVRSARARVADEVGR